MSTAPEPREPSAPSAARDAVYFLDPQDAEEISAALRAEGYDVVGRACDGPGRARWAIDVAPYDDGLVAMVDVYGGWLADEAEADPPA
jgi:hypothetical protein